MKVDVNKFEYRKLTEENIPDLLDFQEIIFSEDENAKETLRRNTYETFFPCFAPPSLVLGVFYEENMIAFGILYVAGEDHENLAYSLDNHELLNVKEYANFKIVIVKKDFRGNGIQSILMKKFEEYAKSIGMKVILATASPKNKYSTNNFDKGGYQLIKVIKKYGGLTRNLYGKELV